MSKISKSKYMTFVLGVALWSIFTSLAMTAFASSQFIKLTGSAIKRVLSGKKFSDGIHFTYRFEGDGKVRNTRMGETTTDKWTIANDKLCLSDRFGKNCYEVWARGAKIKFIIEGDVPFMEGLLR